ncbi:MAG: hypothetical protein KJP09_01545 [Bacteroidia bacterium]|nr:hypothetical protein [Bacteroidia bacterium]NND10311.1 hypothetical protein [Flavobacteriaceae bacterium]MBT8309814.1 hypothetical protein [Bacteroidia bacterium]NNK26628.1 hypothetical protein [Flavobacteriaceae bacterium]NNL60214.1 hypothetical protein [Flavobacteriaceae bacterium]
MYQLILVIFLIAFGNNPYETQMVWNEDYRLQWSDFKAQPEEGIDAVAITASGLSSDFSARTTSTRLVDYSSNVVAHFYPDKSWYKPSKVNEIVLAHEQLHFDITELNARKLRKRIAEFGFTINIKSEMNVLVEMSNKELAKMQELYDDQSNYSMNIEAQKKWQLYIRDELNKLSNYK